MPRLQPKELFEALLYADTEGDVVRILTDAGYWNDPSTWRYYGDEPENWATVGNQQSRPDHALVEKLTNAIDTKLIAAALMKGVPTEGSKAPPTMAAARALLFDGNDKDVEDLSKSITVAATGRRQRPSITIVDDGEGQTPTMMPQTILSLHKSNKGSIPFVQGKFNMGGSGVLEFCGIDHNVELILSRKNPQLLQSDAPPEDHRWSFTVIRRQDPGPNSPRSSRFVYLAPGQPDTSGKKGLLTFDARTMPIFPDRNQPYVREVRWGTLFKLYEYGTRSVTNMMLEDGLMMRIRLLLPEPALPIRFHECRDYKGHAGSYDTPMAGLIYTLEQDRRNPKRQNVEWYDRTEIDIEGEKFTVRVYLFRKQGKDEKKNPIENYRKDEGVVFTYNGQCQTVYSKDFFRRKRVNQDYLSNSMLVFVDCTAIGVRAHEKLFMANRESLRQGSLKLRLERELEDYLRGNDELKRMAETRRKGEFSDNPETSETFEKFIENMVKDHPLLEQVLGPGFRISNPFKPYLVETQQQKFEGKRFPTKFHFRNIPPGNQYNRDAHLKSNVRVQFETDAENDYLRRDEQPGEFKLFQIVDGERRPASNWSTPHPSEGIATLTITSLPAEAQKGDILTYEAEINDPSRIEPFINRFSLLVKGRRKSRPPGLPPKDREQPIDKKGEQGQNDTRLNVPHPHEVWEKAWKDHDPQFTRSTAMVIKRPPDADENSTVFDYFINMDNVFLDQAIKTAPRRTKEYQDRFKFGMTLISLALIRHDLEKRKMMPIVDEEDEETGERILPNIREIVSDATSAIAPFLLPMVNALSAITGIEHLSVSAGEAA